MRTTSDAALHSTRTPALIGEEEIDAVAAVRKYGHDRPGAWVAAFEEEFAAALVPGTHAVASQLGN